MICQSSCLLTGYRLEALLCLVKKNAGTLEGTLWARVGVPRYGRKVAPEHRPGAALQAAAAGKRRIEAGQRRNEFSIHIHETRPVLRHRISETAAHLKVTGHVEKYLT